MIVDFHTHIFSPKIKQDRIDYLVRDACFAELYSAPQAKIATADDLIVSMDENNIDVSVVLNIGWSDPELCTETNDYIMESVARFPKRLAGFGMVQPKFPDAALAELKRCVKGGLKGIGELRPDVQGYDLNDQELMTPLVEAMVKNHLILLTHASEPLGHAYPGKGTMTPDKLFRFAAAYPKLTLVCAHWGGGLPFFALMPEVRKALGNVYFDTAASLYLYNAQIYRQVVSLLGAEKILFGTDYPLLSPNRVLKEIKPLALGKEPERLILGGNAEKLLDMCDCGT